MPPLVYLVAAGRHFSHRHRASLTLQLPHTYTHQKSRYIVTLGERKKNRWNIRRKVARQKQNYHTRNAGGCSSILFRTLFFKSSLSFSLSILLRYFFVTNSFFFFFKKRFNVRTFRSLFDIFARAKFENKIKPNYPGKLFVTPGGIEFCFFVFPLFDSIGLLRISPLM